MTSVRPGSTDTIASRVSIALPSMSSGTGKSSSRSTRSTASTSTCCTSSRRSSAGGSLTKRPGSSGSVGGRRSRSAVDARDAGGCGGATSASTSQPSVYRCRTNDSFDVFSSSRRTRYAMPGTSSPTGTYTRVRTPRSRTASCSGSAMPCSTCTSIASSGRPSVRAPRTAPTRCCGRCGSRTRAARRRRSATSIDAHASYGRVGRVLVGPHRRPPALRAGLDRLDVPVRALDEPDLQRTDERVGRPLDRDRRGRRAASTRYAWTTQPSCGPSG